MLMSDDTCYVEPSLLFASHLNSFAAPQFQCSLDSVVRGSLKNLRGSTTTFLGVIVINTCLIASFEKK